jgi:putative tryptophan/tyrosine transport system substrate-binding protein
MNKTFRIRFGFSCSDNWKSKTCAEPRLRIQNRKLVGLVTFVIAFAMCGPKADAQQPTKIPRIGLLGGGSASANAGRIGAFRQGLRELGYVEGKNVVMEYRWAEGKLDRLPAFAAELVRLKVAIIVSAGPTVTRVAKEATVTIPIVMGFDDDPVGSGFVASLARPAGNITGLSALSPELSGKQLELLKEIVPRLSRVAVLGSSTHPGTAQSLKEIELAREAFKVQIQYLDVLDPKDIDTTFGAMSKGRADAVLVLTSVFTNSHRKQIVELAAKNRLPAIYYTAEWVEAGGLMTYGASFTDLFRRAATYVDRILKGAKPADLPVEQPKKFELVINLKTAKQIGLTIPQKVLGQADKVIK